MVVSGLRFLIRYQNMMALQIYLPILIISDHIKGFTINMNPWSSNHQKVNSKLFMHFCNIFLETSCPWVSITSQYCIKSQQSYFLFFVWLAFSVVLESPPFYLYSNPFLERT